MKNGNALHVYYGDGKGKTTAAMGLALRALGQDKRVFIAQFLKRNNTGERFTLEALPNARWFMAEPVSKLTSRMTPGELQCEKERQLRNFVAAAQSITEEHPDVIILDEIMVAIHLGLLNEAQVWDRIEMWLAEAEVICTGRWASDMLLLKADYITHMVKERHPYDTGVAARFGIEV